MFRDGRVFNTKNTFNTTFYLFIYNNINFKLLSVTVLHKMRKNGRNEREREENRN